MGVSEKMTYKLHNMVTDKVQTFSSILDQLSLSQADLVIITNLGKKIFTQKAILSIFSRSVASWFSSLASCPSDLVSIFMDASFESVHNMLELLTKGEVKVENEDMFFDLITTAEMFDIDMKNLMRGNSVKNESEEEHTSNFVDENTKTIKIENEEDKKENKETYSVSNSELNTNKSDRERTQNKEIKQKLKKHKTLKHGDMNSLSSIRKRRKEKKHNCEECGSLFGLATTLLQHKRVHMQDKPFKCHLCPKQFTQHLNLKKHLQNYATDEEHKEREAKKSEAKKFPCDECDQKLTSKKILERHKESIHNDFKSFECLLCGKRYGLFGVLNKHIKRKH